MEKLEKGLYIVATPIGNLGDVSFRAQKILNLVDFIICENPIHSLKLLNKLGIKKKLLSLHDYNEDVLIKRIEKEQNVSAIALISDAGSPLISDPGYKLIQNYIQKNYKIYTIPGPSSIISALQLSGLPINNFEFFGFIPKNKSSIITLVDNIKNLVSTSVYFVSGSRILNFLQTFDNSQIDRNIAICKEITKKNERVFRGKAKSLITELNENKSNLKGEFVIVIDGKEKKFKKSVEENVKNEIKKLLSKYSLTEVVTIVHNLTKISKNEIYRAALLIKDD